MKKLSQLSHLISSTKCSNNVKHKIEKFNLLKTIIFRGTCFELAANKNIINIVKRFSI